MIRITENEPNWFNHNPAWEMWLEPHESYIWLWDSLGFFTHIHYELWLSEVIEQIPGDFTAQELNEKVRLFMRKYHYLYCCNN